MFCRQCGNRLELGSLFCANCGTKANPSSSGSHFSGTTSTAMFGAQTKEFVDSLQLAGFLKSLFDFSFTSLITTKLIKILYGLSIAGAALWSLFVVILMLTYSPGAGLVMLILSPLFFVFAVSYTRLVLEMIIVIFRIAEHAAEIAQQGRIKETTR